MCSELIPDFAFRDHSWDCSQRSLQQRWCWGSKLGRLRQRDTERHTHKLSAYLLYYLSETDTDTHTHSALSTALYLSQTHRQTNRHTHFKKKMKPKSHLPGLLKSQDCGRDLLVGAPSGVSAERCNQNALAFLCLQTRNSCNVPRAGTVRVADKNMKAFYFKLTKIRTSCLNSGLLMAKRIETPRSPF